MSEVASPQSPVAGKQQLLSVVPSLSASANARPLSAAAPPSSGVAPPWLASADKVGNNNQILATSVWRLATAFLLATCCLLLVACGYHEVGGKSVQLPADVHTVAVPAFENRSTVYHLEQVLTEAVVREFLARTQYRVIAREDPEADAVLHGTILNVIISPLTYDSQTGRASTALITIVMGVKLTGRQGKVLFENPNYIFREQYQLSQDPATFFQEETPAFRRMAQNFSNGLVSNILEAY